MIAADDTRSRSATDCYLYLEGENLPADELAFWRFLAVKAQRYPPGFIPPFKNPKGSSRVRRLLGCRIRTGNNADGQPVPRVLHLYDGTHDRTVDVADGAVGADVFASETLTKDHRSAFIVFANGGRVELRLICQRWGQRLMELGYTIDVLMGGSKLKALVVKKDKHRWYLVDWEALTGLTSRAIASFSGRTKASTPGETYSAITVQCAAVRVQKLMLDWFSVGLSLTLSSTAVRAASRSLPDSVCKFKPAPMLTAMCRDGCGFRGGAVAGRRYRGQAWLVDLNRAYTAALSYPLPWSAALGRCELNGRERAGLFMCRITGRAGLPPIYVAPWDGSGCEPQWVSDTESRGFLAILPSVEVDGIRALGYTVSPGWGMVYARTFTLAAFVERILACCAHYGFQSAEAKLTKLFGNSIYGKFGAHPTRRDIRLGLKRPGRDWMVFVDETGYPVDDLWERETTKYQWTQHIDVAADITARVRGQLYAAQAATRAAGGEVVAVSTDAMVLTIEPSNVLAIHESAFGWFKLADADADGIVAGPNAYAIGSKVIVPDYPNPTRESVLELFTTSYVDAETERSGAPRPGAPLSWKIRKRITMPSSDRCTTMDRQSVSHRPRAPELPHTARSPGRTRRLLGTPA